MPDGTARAKGRTIKIHDQDEDLFKTIQIIANIEIEDKLILPSI